MEDKEILYIDVAKLPGDVQEFMKYWKFLTEDLKCKIVQDENSKTAVSRIEHKPK